MKRALGAQVEAWADSLHSRVVREPMLERFAEVLRVILSMGFFAPGLTKLLGHRFATPAVGEPIYSFFEALYQTGLYWRFLGLGQVLAAVLIIIPSTSYMGAMLFLPIILNIWIVTISIFSSLTPLIASLMLLANIYLVCWHYPRWKSLLPFWSGHPASPAPTPRINWTERLGYIAVALSGWGMFSLTRGQTIPIFREGVRSISYLLGCTGLLLVLGSWIVAALAKFRARTAQIQNR